MDIEVIKIDSGYSTFSNAIKNISNPQDCFFNSMQGLKTFLCYRNIKLTYNQFLEYVKNYDDLNENCWRVFNNEIFKLVNKNDGFGNKFLDEEMIFFVESSYDFLERRRQEESETFLDLIKSNFIDGKKER